jgi:hypothetical protein
MPIRLYLDEDSMDQDLVRALRARGADVTTALDEDMTARSDRDQLEFATSQGRALYTFNVSDFFELHTLYQNEERQHGGIIFGSQQRYSVGEQMRRLLRLTATVPPDSMHGRVEFLSNWESPPETTTD